MHSVTDEQVDFILEDIEKRGVETEDVRFNILDHVCCILENEMPSDGDFYEFYKNTIARFYQKELREIEDETQNLTTFKYYYAMKKTVKISGIISAILIISGVTLKYNQLPGAGIAITLGLVFFSLLFVPLNILLKFRDDSNAQNRTIMSIGMLTASIATLGVLFKVMHWPWANMLMQTSVVIFGLLFIPVYFFTRFKNPDTKFNAIIHSTFMVAGAGMLFALMTQKVSKNVSNSLFSLDLFEEDNRSYFTSSNASLYEEFKQHSNARVEQLHKATTVLNDLIKGIKSNLVSQSNEAPAPSETSLEDFRNINDYSVVTDHFAQAKGTFSLTNLQEMVKQYNQTLASLETPHVLRPLELDRVQLSRTVVSIVWFALSEMQAQILANENSYLSLSKGVLAQR